MHRVAAKVTQEVTVFLQQGHLHTCPRQQQPEDHASRAAADNRTRGCLNHQRSAYGAT